MRIVVTASLEAASQLAHAINTVKMAHAFACLGHDVTLVCTRPLAGPVPFGRLAKIYGLTAPVQWVQLPNHRLTGHYWLFGWLAWRQIRRLRPHFVYTRTYVVPWLTSRHAIPTAGETHAHIGNNKLPFRLFLRATHHEAFRLLVTISHRLAAHYQERGVPAAKLAVLADAVDLELFQRPAQLPPSPYTMPGPHIVYAGHLYDYKGIPTILQAAVHLPAYQFHLVGGRPSDISRQCARAYALGLTNIHFHGLQPHGAVPPYLWHADVLLLPPSRHHPSAAWTSPVKLGEYLASGVPVVATSIPALQDWVTAEEVCFVQPDNGVALAQMITAVLHHEVDTIPLRAAALRRAQTMSYRQRAQTVLQRCGFAE